MKIVGYLIDINVKYSDELTLGVAVDSDYGPSRWRREGDYWTADVNL